MTRDIKVQAKADYIASLSHSSPLSAIEELVWNALDADNKISLFVRYTDLATGETEDRILNKNQ